MTNNLSKLLKTSQKPLLVSYLMTGYPNFTASLKFAETLIENGTDILELGIPFSDPMADGKLIANSAKIALEANIKLADGLKLAAHLRAKYPSLPIILMGYLNPFLKYPMADLAKSGKALIDGLIIVDLPIEENHQYKALLKANQLSLIELLSPNTSLNRA